MAEPIRLGCHGSRQLVWDIVLAAGLAKEDVELLEYPIADPFGPLRRGAQDAIILKFGLDEPDLATSGVLATDPRAAVVALNHPLANRESISIEELGGIESFRAPGGMPDYVWDQVVPPRTPGGAPIHRVHGWSTVPELIDLVVGAGAVPPSLGEIAEGAPPPASAAPTPDLPPPPGFLCSPQDHGSA